MIANFSLFHFLLFFAVEAAEKFSAAAKSGPKEQRTWYNLVGGSFKWSTSVTNLKAAASTWFLCLSQMRESPKEKPELVGVHEKQKNLKRRRFASLSGLAAKKVNQSRRHLLRFHQERETAVERERGERGRQLEKYARPNVWRLGEAVDISCGPLQLKAVKCSQCGACIVIDLPGMADGEGGGGSKCRV